LGIGEVIVAKHRNGACGYVRLRFIPELAKFADLETGSIRNFAGGMGHGPDGMQTITRPSRMNDAPDDPPPF
jgi:replicative DNA helicase